VASGAGCGGVRCVFAPAITFDWSVGTAISVLRYSMWLGFSSSRAPCPSALLHGVVAEFGVEKNRADLRRWIFGVALAFRISAPDDPPYRLSELVGQVERQRPANESGRRRALPDAEAGGPSPDGALSPAVHHHVVTKSSGTVKDGPTVK